jgi:basic amino acid/polyamine antiporter, APA family
MPEEAQLRRGINLPMAVFVIVGLVIGASTWLLPTSALAKAGPGMFLAPLIAVIPGIFIALICAYIGGTAPTAGGSYVVISRGFSPWAGAIFLAILIPGVGGALSFMATTFGIFVNALGLQIPVLITGVAVLLIAYLVNILKVEVSAGVEMAITLGGDVLVILLFIIFGLPHMEAANLTPLFPNGFGAVLSAAILFVFCYAGFTAVLDVGGEIQNPKKNIPRALAIGMVILVGLYTLQAFVVAATTPWTTAAEQIASTGTYTVTEAASPFMPPALLGIMPVLILVAIASSIHPMMLAFSRDFLMAGRDHVLPPWAARIHARHGSPVGGLTVVLAFSLLLFLLVVTIGPALGIPLQGLTELFAAISVSGVLVGQILICLAALRLPKKYPEWHRNSSFRLEGGLLWFLALGGIITSAAFLVLLGLDTPLIIELLVALAVPGLVYYFIRRAYLARRSINLTEVASHWPASVSAADTHEEIASPAQPEAALG